MERRHWFVSESSRLPLNKSFDTIIVGHWQVLSDGHFPGLSAPFHGAPRLGKSRGPERRELLGQGSRLGGWSLADGWTLAAGDANGNAKGRADTGGVSQSGPIPCPLGSWVLDVSAPRFFSPFCARPVEFVQRLLAEAGITREEDVAAYTEVLVDQGFDNVRPKRCTP
jgi:hypothetical protein